ncbi:hypothetical protein AL755_02035 (plasmid) [Arthrobacter sp. ERGS1:01]|uniref:GlxA family transcriptional regulator n=1 Tax=Arthrobacter sp. ERGS1:01 TaxID=1704044 RepID=UPI0006B54802|nr:helix-turn-helix domain-containing protein [Arthrobacter sp. ERGS1:01]ALE04480.1 hypothetical protein AL755_02035 [Arthrobacter sp. ERGS1:01]
MRNYPAKTTAPGAAVPERIKVAVLALPEVLALDFGIPIQILGRNAAHLYEVATCSAGGLPVRADGGFTVVPDRGLELLEEVSTIVIPGFTSARLPLHDDVRLALQAAHARGARLVSICTGAFALAQAGILDGVRATTHWEHTAEMARLYPAVAVDENVLFVESGQVLTSAGVAAGIDLCLHIVKSDWGAAEGNRTARSTVAAPRREGTQSQFIERRPRSGAASQPRDVAAAMEWAGTHLERPITIGQIATAASLSERTLSRRFDTHVGLTPMKWLAVQRIDRAKELLETTTAPVEAIGASVGLGSGANFRQVFKKSTSLTPSQYRHAFTRKATGV